jgi:hypothetical protein
MRRTRGAKPKRSYNEAVLGDDTLVEERPSKSSRLTVSRCIVLMVVGLPRTILLTPNDIHLRGVLRPRKPDLLVFLLEGKSSFN